MSNKNRKFKSYNKSNVKKRVVRRVRFDRHGHLIDTMLKPENSSKLEDNLNNVIDFTTNEVYDGVEEFISNDEEFSKTWDNTSIVDDDGNEVSAKAKQEAHRNLIHQGTNDTIKDVTENDGEKYTKEIFFKRALKNVLDRLDFLRTNAEKDNEKTQENTGKSLVSKFKKVKVFARDILSMFDADKKATQAYEQKITDNAPTVKAKVLWNKCKQHKYKIAAGFASMLLLTACITDSNKKAPEKKAALTEQKAAPAPAPAPAKTQEVKADTVIVQTEYSDSLQVSNVAWERTKSFFGEKYELANKRLTNKIMKENFDSLTREYVLNQLAYNITSYSEKKISKWEKALNDGLKDEKTQEIVQAYRASQQVICYLTDVTVKEFPKEAKDIFINQEVGNLNKVVESVTFRDCDNIDVKYKTLKSKTISWEQAVEQVADTLQADTTETQKDFVLGGGSVEFKKKDVQNDSIADASFTYNKGKENFENNKVIRESDADEALNRQTKDKKLMLEGEGSSSETAGITYNKGDNLDNGKVLSKSTNQVAASRTVTGKDIMLEENAQEQVASNQTDFTDVTGEKKVEKAAEAVVSDQEGFVDVTGEKKVEKADTASVQILAAKTVVDNAEYDVVEGTDGVEPGTPALESISPRGGYNHTDVSLANIEFAKKILGEDTYNTIVENASNHKEWLERGNFAEGLTPEELAVITAVRTKVFPYAKSTSALRKTVICEDTLSVEMNSQVADAIKKVNQNYTIDGVDYNQQTNTVSVKHNGCDEKETVNIERNNISKVTHPSGPKLPRMFKIPRAQNDFALGGGSVEYLTLPQEIIEQAAKFNFNKGNEIFGNRVTLRDAEASEFFDLKIKNPKNIMLEDGQSEVSNNGVASYMKGAENFGSATELKKVPVDETTKRQPRGVNVAVEQQEITQAMINKKLPTNS